MTDQPGCSGHRRDIFSFYIKSSSNLVWTVIRFDLFLSVLYPSLSFAIFGSLPLLKEMIVELLGSRDAGTLVKPLASHQCGPGSIPGLLFDQVSSL